MLEGIFWVDSRLMSGELIYSFISKTNYSDSMNNQELIRGQQETKYLIDKICYSTGLTATRLAERKLVGWVY